MKADVKKKFIAELRSGDYNQGFGGIRKRDKFCAIGVLCNLHAKENPEYAATQYYDDMYAGSAFTAGPEVRVWSGISAEERHNIIMWNDHQRLSFAQIADKLEKNEFDV